MFTTDFITLRGRPVRARNRGNVIVSTQKINLKVFKGLKDFNSSSLVVGICSILLPGP